MGTWVRDSGQRTTLGSREWSTKNELTEERERERAGTRGGSGKRRSPPQAEVCGGAAVGPFLRLLQSLPGSQACLRLQLHRARCGRASK